MTIYRSGAVPSRPPNAKHSCFSPASSCSGASVRVVRAARDDGRRRRRLARRSRASWRQWIPRAADKGSATAGRSRALERRASEAVARPPDRRVERAADTSRWVVSHSRVVRSQRNVAHQLTVDLDVAEQSDIETLPRIGPVLARRIIEDRTANGPFGSIEGFQRVRGVGPSLAAALRARVTFSGTARPSNAVVDPRLRSPPASSKSPRRERRTSTLDARG